MSWRPLSWLLVSSERYLYSCVSASSVFGLDLGDLVWAAERSELRTEDARRGIGSSGFVEWVR